MVPDLPLLAAGRDADVFDLGDGRVLRRYRRRDVPAREIEVMRYVHARGYPVPRVLAVSGPDLTLEMVEGPTMQQALMADLGGMDERAAGLAELHHRLHALEAPDWLPQLRPGDRVLHLDLHPSNVILSATGPVVIDWANASAGPAALDPALMIAIALTAKANVERLEREHIDAFIRSFASHFDAAELRAAMPDAIELRAADANVTDEERAELLGSEWPI